MKKLSKGLVLCLLVVTIISTCCVGVSANEITFVDVDEQGNETVVELELVPELVEMYNNLFKQRDWNTTFYDLSANDYTMYGGSAAYVTCGKHFNANSSGRIYYLAETSGNNAYVSLLDKSTNTFVGSFLLVNQGDGTYHRNGYFAGLNTSSSRYYTVDITAQGASAVFDDFYTVFSWSSLN